MAPQTKPADKMTASGQRIVELTKAFNAFLDTDGQLEREERDLRRRRTNLQNEAEDLRRQIAVELKTIADGFRVDIGARG